MKDGNQDEMMEAVCAFLVDAAHTKRGWLLGLASPLLPLAHDAEDAVQQSFLLIS